MSLPPISAGGSAVLGPQNPIGMRRLDTMGRYARFPSKSGHVGPTSSPFRARRVGFTESFAQVCHREFAARRDRGGDPVTLAVGGLFEVRDLVRRGVVGRVLVQQRQMPLPDAFGT